MAISSQERLAMLQEVSQSWLDLRKAIEARSDAELTRPNTVGQWSVKDVMGHVTFWEGRLLGGIKAEEAGQDWDEINDFESANLVAASEVASHSLDEIRAQFDETHDELMGVLEVTPLLSRDRIEGATFGHYNEHTSDIRAIRS